MHYTEFFNRDPAWRLVHEADYELQNNRWVGNQTSGISYELEAIVATVTEDNKPIGFIAFEYVKWNHTLSIHMAYVIPELRGLGVHGRMFEHLVENAKKRDIVKITSSTHHTNESALKAFEKQGRKKTFISFTYDLKDI